MSGNPSTSREKIDQSIPLHENNNIPPPIDGMCIVCASRLDIVVNSFLNGEPIVIGPFKELSIQDKLLSPFILLAMILGVVIGEFVPNVRNALDTAKFESVSLRMYIVRIRLSSLACQLWRTSQ